MFPNVQSQRIRRWHHLQYIKSLSGVSHFYFHFHNWMAVIFRPSGHTALKLDHAEKKNLHKHDSEMPMGSSSFNRNMIQKCQWAEAHLTWWKTVLWSKENTKLFLEIMNASFIWLVNRTQFINPYLCWYRVC